MDYLTIFNYVSLLIFVVLVTLIGARMIWRLIIFIFFKVPIPQLLKRDIILFFALGTYFGSTLLALAVGVQGLNREWLWVIPRGLIVLGATAYWAWVEYHIDDGTPKLKGN